MLSPITIIVIKPPTSSLTEKGVRERCGAYYKYELERVNLCKHENYSGAYCTIIITLAVQLVLTVNWLQLGRDEYKCSSNTRCRRKWLHRYELCP